MNRIYKQGNEDPEFDYQELVDTRKKLGEWKEIAGKMKEEIQHLQAQLSSKERECEKLKNDLLDMMDIKNGKGPTALSMAIYEIKSLRSEAEQLKSDLYHTQSNLEIAGKRCEDLEAALEGIMGNSFALDHISDKWIQDTLKLLSQ